MINKVIATGNNKKCPGKASDIITAIKKTRGLANL
jgi:hypothetical protein